MSKRGEKKIVCGTCKSQGVKPHEQTLMKLVLLKLKRKWQNRRGSVKTVELF